MSRRVLLAAAALAIFAVVLVITGGEPPATESASTVDGVDIEIPSGWEVREDIPFVYRDPKSPNGDSFTVALTCGDGDCVTRDLDEWLTAAESLPTFTAVRADPADLFATVDESTGSNWIQSRATTHEGAVQVAVAVFAAGSDRYLECVSFSNQLSESVIETLAESCRQAELPDGQSGG